MRENAEASACPPKPGEGWKRRLVRPGVFTDNELRAESEFGAPRQYQAATQPNPRNHENEQTGLFIHQVAKCSKCGSSMVVTDKARKKYLYCNQRINNVNCVGGGILYEVFEVVLLECLGESLATSGYFENKNDTKDLQFKIDAKTQELKESGQKFKKLADLVLEADAPQVLVQKMKVLEAEQVAIKKEIENLQTALLDAQGLPDEYRLLMAAIAKGLKQKCGERVTIDLNVRGES